MDNKYRVQDLLKFSVQQQPIEFETAFNSLITDRIAAAVDNKKMDMAGSIYSDEEQYYPEEEETEEE